MVTKKQLIDDNNRLRSQYFLLKESWEKQANIINNMKLLLTDSKPLEKKENVSESEK